jgi:hypothetical protein
VEWGIVTSSFTMLGTGLGAKKAGASTHRSFWASLARTVVGGAVALALIEPLDAGWTVGAIGFTVSQGVTVGLIAGR